MLLPTNRLTRIDAMRPPAGFQLESAMAVTFTLNLGALLAAPAAFAIAGLRDTTADASGSTPVELIHALRTHAHKLTVFSEAGEIGLPPPSRAFAFLERAVVPVKAPWGGIVHPKAWVLRYQVSGDQGDEETPERLRVLISSRNLTFDESWDTLLRLDETPDPGGAALGGVGRLFRGLVDNAVGGISADHRERVNSLARDLQTARFELPVGVDDLTIHVLGFEQASAPFPENADRSLVISPFLADHFFEQMLPPEVNTLVSRQSSLDGLSSAVLGAIKNKYIFDDGSVVEQEEPAGGAAEPSGGAAPSPEDPGKPLVGVHAKVFAFETGDEARLFIGSANATGAAFNSNVEILAELRGSVAELGIDRLCHGDGDNPGLAELFHVYHPAPEEPGCDGSGDPVLDQTRRQIACLRMEGTLERTGKEGHEWAVTYRSEKSLPTIDGVEIRCWPLTTPGNRRQAGHSTPFKVRFETTLEALSGFLAFELTHDSGEQTEFVVPVPLVGVPARRSRLLLKALIGNAERFLRYLMALLYEDTDLFDLREVSRTFDGSASDGNGLINLAVLEKLLRTMRSHPLRLAGLHPLIADLRADDALPPGFADLWDAIHRVAIEGADEPGADLS